MPIEIKEIVLKASISNSSNHVPLDESKTEAQSSKGSNDNIETILQDFKSEILMECMDLIAEQRITHKRR